MTLTYITGAAGTGKTYELTQVLPRWFDENSLLPHQKILALTRMHGSRKRLNERLTTNSIRTQIKISTVDSFALEIANRWRLSFGYESPIVPSSSETLFVRDELGYRASFNEIMELAARIVEYPIVAKTISNSYPIILVDEFQDCTGYQLSLLQNLLGYIDLVLAADPFQSLDVDESACEWVESLTGQQNVEVIRLSKTRRTNCSYLQDAAHALLSNKPVKYGDNPLPFFIVPNYNLAPWKIIPGGIPRNDTVALIYPANKAFINLSNSVERQNDTRKAKGKNQIFFPWIQQLRNEDIEQQLISDLANAIEDGISDDSKMIRGLYDQVYYLAKVKGYEKPIQKHLEYIVTSFLQARKYVNSKPIKYEATTVHGAKNREFDHVFILWHDNLCSKYNDEQKRRLLYNAITRAKNTCKVVAVGTRKNIMASPVLSLLGEPQEPK